MSKINLAVGIAAALSLSTAAYATNEITDINVAVTAYIAAGLGVESSPMEFGALVAPTNGTGPSSVKIECNGNVTYSTNGSPAGPGGNEEAAGEANASVAEPTLPSRGSIDISGEPDYAVTVTVEAGDVPVGVVFVPGILPTTNCVGDADGNYQLDSAGDLELSLFGELLVNPVTDAPSSAAINTSAVITVSYR